MLFSAKQRLKKPAEFSAVYNGNQTRVKGQYFTVLAFFRFEGFTNSTTSDTIGDKILLEPSRTDNSDCVNHNIINGSRVGVVVSKKVSKLAVQRNRIKRLIRESYRTRQGQGQRQHPDGFDFVVIARPGAAKADNAQLYKELNKLWHRLHKRCDAF